jgi:hypothetical protein
MYTHLVLEPDSSKKEDIIESVSSNLFWQNQFSEETRKKLRDQGLDLISRGKGIISCILSNLRNKLLLFY